MQIWGSFKSATNLGEQIANPQIAKSIGSANRKSANCHTFGRSANVTNFVGRQICGFSEAWRKMVHKKNLKQKSCDIVPLKQNTRMYWCHYTKLYKNTISWNYPFKKQYLQNYHPLLRSEGGNLQTDAAQLFLFDPIPAKAKKLGLLSIYKFSLVNLLSFLVVE